MIEQVERLSDVINLIGGGTPKRSKKEYWNGDISWLSVKDFNHGGRYVEESDETITKLGLEKSSTKLLQPGMLIISARGTVGELAQLKSEMAFNQSCYGIDANTDYLQNDYLYYLLKLKIRELKSIAHGSVFDTITRETFENIEVGIPNKSTQKAIAHILGTLDDKIELNQKMNQILEQIAKAIFKSWFVDFDPVRAKAEGHPTGLPPEISDLFPEEFVDSEIGEIPSGWKVAALSDITDVTMGQSPPGSTYNDNEIGLPFYQGSTDFGFRFPSIRKFCSEPNRLAEKDDVLLSVRAPVGDLNRALNQCCIGRGLASIRSKSGFSSWIFYRCSFLKEYFDTFNSEGTVFGSVNKTDLRGIKTPVANSEILNCFEDIASPMDKGIRVRTDEIRVLSELRDALLPKLISGELRIPDAEKFLEEAGI